MYGPRVISQVTHITQKLSLNDVIVNCNHMPNIPIYQTLRNLIIYPELTPRDHEPL